MPKGSLNMSLKGADDIFSTEESRQEQQREQVQQIPIGQVLLKCCSAFYLCHISDPPFFIASILPSYKA